MLQGCGITFDQDADIALLITAAMNGNAHAQHLMAVNIYNGSYVRQNKNLGMQLLEKSSGQQYYPAVMSHAEMIGDRSRRIGMLRSIDPSSPEGEMAKALLYLGSEDRSEEHTSELQSLMRITYAVFCLQKNKTHAQKTHSE